MKNNSKILLAVGFGILAGGVAGYYLNSEKGIKARKQVAKAIRDKTDEANAKMNEMAENAKTVINDLVAKAKVDLTKAAATIEETVEAVQAKVKKANGVTV